MFACLSEHAWKTNREIAAELNSTYGVLRTVRKHTQRLTMLGIAEFVGLWPEFRYRLSPEAVQRNPGYLRRLRFTQDDLRGFAGPRYSHVSAVVPCRSTDLVPRPLTTDGRREIVRETTTKPTNTPGGHDAL